MSDRTRCRTPEGDPDKGTNIPSWKFDLLRGHILDGLAEGPVSAKALGAEVEPKLSEHDRDRLGAFGWHYTTVRLEMEVRGEIGRVPGASPVELTLP